MNIKNIKSWYFSLSAIIIQGVFAVYWFLFGVDVPPVNPNDDLTSINAVPALFAFFSVIIMGLLLIPTVLLKINNDKTKKVGSVLSMIFGIIGVGYLLLILINNLEFQGSLNSYIIIYFLQVIQAGFLLAAAKNSNPLK
jgi:hypothetical protein